jgi:iron-sulfur cluster assembly accessory protein
MNKPMITFSKAAQDHILSMVDKHGAEHVFHLSIKETGCTGLMYVPQIIKRADITEQDIAIEGEHAFGAFLANEAVPAVKGTHIDYVMISLGQKQLSYNNPNADSLCGCGESFNLKKEQQQDECDDTRQS